MAFAKMHIPSELRTRYLLTEADFALNESSEGEDGPSLMDPSVTMAGSKLEDGPSPSSPKSPQRQLSSPALVDNTGSPKQSSGQKPASRQASAGARSDSNTMEEDGKRRGSPGRNNRMNRQASAEQAIASDGLSSPNGNKSKRPRSRQTREKDAISMSEKASQLGLYA
jgi:hypothetical protein